MSLSEKGIRDLELINKALEGEQSAFTELYDLYRNSLYFMILKMVNNPTDAEDLTIEAFAKAFRNLHQYKPKFAFSSWLFRIATNNCTDFIRKKRLELIDLEAIAPTILETKMTQAVPAESDPEKELIIKERVQEVENLISSLKLNYQQLVRLRYFEEYTYEEISVALDIPLGTVKAQLFRTRKILEPLLDQIKDKDQ